MNRYGEHGVGSAKLEGSARNAFGACRGGTLPHPHGHDARCKMHDVATLEILVTPAVGMLRPSESWMEGVDEFGELGLASASRHRQ